MDELLRVQAGGTGHPALLLVHGLGATGDVWTGWRPLLQTDWPGRWFAPDLPGHGGSPPLPRYSFGAFASSVADLLGPDDDVVVIGHSLGGAVGLALASGWFGVRVRTVVVSASRSPGPRMSSRRPARWPRRRPCGSRRARRRSNDTRLCRV